MRMNCFDSGGSVRVLGFGQLCFHSAVGGVFVPVWRIKLSPSVSCPPLEEQSLSCVSITLTLSQFSCHRHII